MDSPQYIYNIREGYIAKSNNCNGEKQRNHISPKPPIQPLSYHNPCIRHTCGRLCV